MTQIAKYPVDLQTTVIYLLFAFELSWRQGTDRDRERGEREGERKRVYVDCRVFGQKARHSNRDTWTVKRREKPCSGNLSTATERFCLPARPKIGQFPSYRGFVGEFSSTSPVPPLLRCGRSIPSISFAKRRLIITIRRRNRDRSGEGRS